MSYSANFVKNATAAGQQHAGSVTVQGDHHAGVNLKDSDALPAAKSGALTTRTDDNTWRSYDVAEPRHNGRSKA